MTARDRGAAGAGPEGLAPAGRPAPDAARAGVYERLVPEIIAEFSELFAFARTRWTRYAEEVHPELRGPGLLMLQMIKRKGPITATEIAQLLQMDKAMVSRQLAKLRELGFVDAEPSADDRRVILLTASDEAHRLVEEIRHRWGDAYHERFAGWDEHDLEALRSLLHRFNRDSGERPAEGPAHRCSRDQHRQEPGADDTGTADADAQPTASA